MTWGRAVFDWTDKADLVAAVRAWLVDGAPRPDGLDWVDGRLDLRGFPLGAGPVQVGAADRVQPPLWESLDLRGAQLDELRLFGLTVRNCLFDGASCRGWRLWGVRVEQCSFVGTDLRGSALGSADGPQTQWVETSLARANLAEVSFVKASLERCAFQSPSKVSFVDCFVWECEFAGSLRSVVIDGRRSGGLLSADFRQAVFRDAQLIGYDLGEALLSMQADLRVIADYPLVVQRALTLLDDPSTEVEKRAAAILGWLMKAPGSDDSDWCFDLNSFATSDDFRLADYLDALLRKAMA